MLGSANQDSPIAIPLANGRLLSAASTEATVTIDYVATDSAGNTATSTRTVIVESTDSAASTATSL
jgi:hypothetical protein